jgi:hypothetical protein
LALLACGAGPKGETPETSPDASPSSEPGGDAFAVTGKLQREELPEAVAPIAVEPHALPPLPKGIAAAPASCGRYATRKGPGACEPGTSRTALDAALALTGAAERDAALLAIEECADLPPGSVRALRADLAPPECGDAIAGTLVATPPAGIDGNVYEALVGLALAGMLSRAALAPPKVEPPFTKQRVADHIKGPMGAWVREQAAAIESIAARGAKLRGYGKAVVAIEAGMAEMRFVLAARDVPVPEEIAKFPEASETYYQNLELSLDARKQRGRDAALVGLGQLAQHGTIRDERLDRARDMLAQIYGGSAIKTLDALELPPLGAASPNGVEERLATRLSSFYAGLFLPADGVLKGNMLRMLLEQGLPLPQRIALARAKLSPEQRMLVARGRVEMAQNYWRAVDVDEAVALLADTPRSPDANLLMAVALALRGGPANAADMIVSAPVEKLGIGNVRALDSIAKGDDRLAQMAAFDAALILQLATPPDSDAAAWRALAQRYRAAASRMKDVRTREAAEKRAREADDTALAIEKRKAH